MVAATGQPSSSNIITSNYDWSSSGFITIDEAREQAIQNISDAAVGNRIVFPSGYDKLDDTLMGGFTPGKLYTIGARPSVGKSLFSNELLFGIMENAKKHNKKVIALYWTFEMSAADQIIRMIVKEVQLGMHDLYSIKTPLSNNTIQLIIDKTKRYKDYDVYFKEMSTTITNTFNTIDRIHKAHPDHTIINLFDHARLFSKDNERSEIEKLVNLTQGLVKIQQKTKCINILLSQLNRDADNANNKSNNYVPKMSQLFGSDSLGQESHCVILLNRPRDMYNIMGKYCGQDTEDLLAVHVVKNRDYKTGLIPFDINLDTLTISERT